MTPNDNLYSSLSISEAYMEGGAEQEEPAQENAEAMDRISKELHKQEDAKAEEEKHTTFVEGCSCKFCNQKRFLTKKIINI